MTGSWFGGEGGESFEDFLDRFFGPGAPRRPVQRLNIARLMSEPARQLLRQAVERAVDWRSADLDTDHMLWAATRQEPTRQLLTRVGADPQAIAEEAERTAGHGTLKDGLPQLTPAGKRALMDAHHISRVLGASYIGPEHILFALAVNPDSPAGRILGTARIFPEALQSAAGGGGGPPPVLRAQPAHPVQVCTDDLKRRGAC